MTILLSRTHNGEPAADLPSLEQKASLEALQQKQKDGLDELLVTTSRPRSQGLQEESDQTLPNSPRDHRRHWEVPVTTRSL